MEIRIEPKEMERMMRESGILPQGWQIKGISRATGLIPTIKVYLEKEEKQVEIGSKTALKNPQR